jgi:hypothetical protein
MYCTAQQDDAYLFDLAQGPIIIKSRPEVSYMFKNVVVDLAVAGIVCGKPRFRWPFEW